MEAHLKNRAGGKGESGGKSLADELEHRSRVTDKFA